MNERFESAPHESVLSPERYPVASRVIEMRRGEQVGSEILDRINSPETSRVVVLGEPGNGKTTLVSELLAASDNLNSLTGSHSRIDVFFYDKFLAREQSEVKIPFDEWDPPQWFRFNWKMHERLSRARNRSGRHGLQVIELPGVGYTRNKNRGVTCMELLARESSQRENDTLFLFMVRNRAIQDKAARIRGAVRDIPSIEVADFLARNNVFIKGVEEGRRGGEKIKKLFSKMGKDVHIDAIRREESNKANSWMEKNIAVSNDLLSGITPVPLVTPEDLESDIASVTGHNADFYRSYASRQIEMYMDEAVRNAAYMEHVFEVELGVPPENFYLLGNPYMRDPTYIDFSRFERRKRAA